MRTGFYIFLGILSLSLAFNIKTNVTDGIPDFLNVSTAPFQKIGDHYYYVNLDSQANWFAASEVCAAMDAKLIDFDSLEEWDLVNNYLNDTNIHKLFWTSVTNLADENSYTWFSNGKPMTLDIWYPGEPNNKEVENCVEMGRIPYPPKSFGLNDIKCLSKRRYICKTKQPKTASVIVW